MLSCHLRNEKGEAMMEQERLLKTAFLAGAITGAPAMLPMLVPEPAT
jgi:hypothetical protein